MPDAPDQTKPIDGKAVAKRIKDDLARRIHALAKRGVTASLDAVIATDDDHAAGMVYAANQRKSCNQLGIDYRLHKLPADASEDDIAGRVLLLSKDPEVHGVMVHMPLPHDVDPYRVRALINPEKDVEGVNAANIGNIVYGRSALAPCTALAVVELIKETGIDLRGKRCVVVGASDIVGKPVAVMLMRPEATVISANKHTEDMPALARTADVLVAAAGVPKLVKKDWVKPGATVIDVGIHRVPVEGRTDGTKRITVGDVDADDVAGTCAWLSPVPGGVGPVTVAMLLSNVVDATERQAAR